MIHAITPLGDALTAELEVIFFEVTPYIVMPRDSKRGINVLTLGNVSLILHELKHIEQAEDPKDSRICTVGISKRKQ